MTVTLQGLEYEQPRQPEVVIAFTAQIWRRRRLFGIIFIATLLPVLMVIFFWPRVYFANGTVLIANQEPANSGASPAWIEKLGDPADLESQLLIVQSSRMLRLALARPGVMDAVLEECRYRSRLITSAIHPLDCDKIQTDSQEALDYVQSHYSVSAAGRSRIIAIGYKSPIPDAAFILANALLLTYLEDQRAENARSREAAASWLLEAGKKFNKSRMQETGQAQAAVSGSQSEQNFYQDIYNKVSALEAERRVVVSGGRLVSLAEIPRRPSFPKAIPLLAAGLTFSVMLAGAAALRRDASDPTVRSSRDLEALTKHPVLASLPTYKLTALSSPSRAGDRLAEEAGAGLYARLLIATERKRHYRLVIASASRGDGKSFTAMSIARAAASSSRKVLIIDCNLNSAAERPASVHPVTSGFAGILRGEVEPEEAALSTECPGVDRIEAGCADGSASVLLMNGDMAKLMCWSERYDLVLLETRAGTFPDLFILAHRADGVLWCVRWGHTLQHDVKASLDNLRSQGVRVLGLVLTRVSASEVSYYESPHLPPFPFFRRG